MIITGESASTGGKLRVKARSEETFLTPQSPQSPHILSGYQEVNTRETLKPRFIKNNKSHREFSFFLFIWEKSVRNNNKILCGLIPAGFMVEFQSEREREREVDLR